MNHKLEDLLKLKKGDIISYRKETETEIIDTIYFNNEGDDSRFERGERVTINGTHWYMEDITIVKIKELTMTEGTIKELLTLQEFQKMQEEELRRNFSKEIDTNNPNVKLWLKLREDGK